MEMTWKKWLILKKIYMINNTKNLTFNKISAEIDVSRQHPYFCKLMGELLDEEIVVMIDIVDSTKIFKINHKKLLRLLLDSDIYKEFLDIVKKATPIYTVPS